MQVNLPPDLEVLVNKRLSSGGYASVEDVFLRALEAQDAEESWTDEERKALTAHVEEGFLQAECGELVDGAQVRREIQGMKDNWRQARAPRMSIYALTPVAKDDIFEIWSYIADDNEETTDRIEQAIYDACVFVAEAPMRGHSRSDLTSRSLRFWTLTRYPN